MFSQYVFIVSLYCEAQCYFILNVVPLYVKKKPYYGQELESHSYNL